MARIVFGVSGPEVTRDGNKKTIWADHDFPDAGDIVCAGEVYRFENDTDRIAHSGRAAHEAAVARAEDHGHVLKGEYGQRMYECPHDGLEYFVYEEQPTDDPDDLTSPCNDLVVCLACAVRTGLVTEEQIKGDINAVQQDYAHVNEIFAKGLEQALEKPPLLADHWVPTEEDLQREARIDAGCAITEMGYDRDQPFLSIRNLCAFADALDGQQLGTLKQVRGPFTEDDIMWSVKAGDAKRGITQSYDREEALRQLNEHGRVLPSFKRGL